MGFPRFPMCFDQISHEVPQVLNVFPKMFPIAPHFEKLKHEHIYTYTHPSNKFYWNSLTIVPYENVKYTLF
jgi:hypothetical protein